MQVSVGKIWSQIWLQIWAQSDKAKYREMIFGALKLKFDEDKACSLLSQILTKSAKSAQKTSRKKEKKWKKRFA